MIRFYFYLPHFIKIAVVNYYGMLLKRKRYARHFHEILSNYLESDCKETKNLDLLKIQNQVNTSRFYSIKTQADFYSLPIITKNEIIRYYDQIKQNKNIYSYFFTGGTTGQAFRFPVSKEFMIHQWAIFWKFRMIHGLDMNHWCAYIYGKPLISMNKKKPPYWLNDYFNKQLLMSFTHLNENTIEMFLSEIKARNIKWLHAYPSILVTILNLVEKCNLHSLAKSMKLEIITTSSEILYEYQKKEIEVVFDCKVRQLYGLTEGVANIFECEHSQLHVDESYSYVEFVRETGEYYKIIGTTYYNKAFPLIRYDTGDTVTLYENGFQCPCGRKSRVVKSIAGRTQDYIILKNDIIILPGPAIFQNVQNINKAQIIQRKKGEAEFYVVKNSQYNPKDEKQFISNVKKMLGNDFVHKIIYTDQLIKTGSGKERFVINEIFTANIIQKKGGTSAA